MLVRALSAIVLSLAVASGGGCVKRAIFVRAEPDDAKIFLDGAFVGKAPRKIPFTYYGTRDLVVRAPGRAPAQVAVDAAAPWWEYTPLDFVAEILLPFTIEDEREVFVALERAPPADLEGARVTAEMVRESAKGD